MATQDIQDLLGKMGISALSCDQAVKDMERLLGSGQIRVAVANVDWPLFRALYENKGRRPLLENMPHQMTDPQQEEGRRGGSSFSVKIRDADHDERVTLLTSYLQQVVSKILRLGESSAPDIRQGFTDMGMDSLMTLELKNAVEKEFGHQFSSTLAFDHPTITQLAAFIDKEIGEEAASPVPVATPPEAAGRVDNESDTEALIVRELEELEKTLR